MADIIDISGQKVASSTPQKVVARNAHDYQINLKDGSTVLINGKLFITPLFIAIENETGEWDYIVAFDEFRSLVNADTTEPAEQTA